MKLTVLTVLMLLTLSPITLAQTKPSEELASEPTAPVVSDLDALKLDKAVLTFENLQLRIVSLQAELQKMQGEIQGMVKALERPGYTLNRDQQTGAWRYAKIGPEAKRLEVKP